MFDDMLNPSNCLMLAFEAYKRFETNLSALVGTTKLLTGLDLDDCKFLLEDCKDTREFLDRLESTYGVKMPEPLTCELVQEMSYMVVNRTNFYWHAATSHVDEVRLDENGEFIDPPDWVLEEERNHREKGE